MKTTIILTSKQIKELNDNGSVWFVKPLKEQPPDWTKFIGVEEEDKESSAVFGGLRPFPTIINRQARYYIPLQYPVGTVHKIKGTDDHLRIESCVVKQNENGVWCEYIKGVQEEIGI